MLVAAGVGHVARIDRVGQERLNRVLVEGLWRMGTRQALGGKLHRMYAKAHLGAVVGGEDFPVQAPGDVVDRAQTKVVHFFLWC